MIENYLDNQEQTMQATLTSRRDHNFRVNNRKENQLYNNELITLYERILLNEPLCIIWNELRLRKCCSSR